MTKNGIQNNCSFTGKVKDAETGYGYFGARYMDHELMTMWLSVDPMADKYPNISPYNYCMWNPIKLVDPDVKCIIFIHLMKMIVIIRLIQIKISHVNIPPQNVFYILKGNPWSLVTWCQRKKANTLI